MYYLRPAFTVVGPCRVILPTYYLLVDGLIVRLSLSSSLTESSRMSGNLCGKGCSPSPVVEDESKRCSPASKCLPVKKVRKHASPGC